MTSKFEDLIKDFNESQNSVVSVLNEVTELNENINLRVDTYLETVRMELERVKNINNTKVTGLIKKLADLMKFKIPKTEKTKLKLIKNNLESLKRTIK